MGSHIGRTSSTESTAKKLRVIYLQSLIRQRSSFHGRTSFTENERKELSSVDKRLKAVVEVFVHDWSARNGSILGQAERFYSYMDNYLI
jgi:hypothetical protein